MASRKKIPSVVSFLQIKLEGSVYIDSDETGNSCGNAEKIAK